MMRSRKTFSQRHLPDKPDRMAYYHDMVEAFGQPGCPLCRMLTRSADRYLGAVLWEMVLDPELRAELSESRGYCQQHGWMLVRVGAALGVAILTKSVIGTLLEQLESTSLDDSPDSVLDGLRQSLSRRHASRTTEPLVAAVAPQNPCPVCVYVQTLEEHYISTLLEHMDGPGELVEAYHNSDGLCLPHFLKCLADAPSRTAAKVLVDAQKAVWQGLYDELGEFIRKKDYQAKGEPFGAEKDSWLRALEAISGPPPHSRSPGSDESRPK